ncbi:DNA-binding NarL/FixJ family response regulator [Thermocatellispora tengchongensis]|uniref:DNA-binding NarL/FixJ family response regulator n=1 Tax=Thermocatellispora tengchongensis TaxID=1073253 RepID=A0A840PDF5_9ACTN|nr:response regulator transcription factor [Thermocatellispora tengchongensis]MBB5135973.1 DNA-binding NarL/FixJ family response regulator [Thermocatellispora tengchongensis]
MGRATRVVIVDDDEISLRGIAAILGEPGDGSSEVVAAMDHRAALAWPGEWAGVDVALVDAADERRADDHFPGVEVVERIRAAGGRTRVVVLTGHFFDGAVRRRMREAGADFFYHRSELAEAATLRAAVLGHGGRPVPGPEDAEEEILHGVSRDSRVNAAVRHALAEDLPARIAERRDPRSRSWGRLRREFNRHARLTAMTADGRTPDRPQREPSLPQIARFLAWATRVKTRRPPPLPAEDREPER